MEVSVIIAGIDAQIQKLQEARNILDSVSTPAPAAKAGRGRPKGSKSAVPSAKKIALALKTAAPAKTASAKGAPAEKTGKRKLSPEGRKRIADAMKRRWAERRKTAV